MSFHCIGITYENNLGITKELELIPLGLLFGNRNHYLVAKLAFRDEKKARHFILSRIKNIKILPDVYEEDLSFSLEAHAARSFGTFQEKPFEVEWLFSPNVAENASMMIFHPSQITTHNPDGSLSVKFKAGGRLEMSWHLYTWGNEVKVIKPIDFWEKVPQIPNIIVKEKEK
jgi:predicted DNA-binding transcriptional regulator YafY